MEDAPKFQEVTLFVGNLAFEASEKDLVAAFEGAGHRVSLVKVSRDAEGEQSRGFGFVTVLTNDPNRTISEMYGTNVLGRNIRVDFSTSARSREDRATTTAATFSGGDWAKKSWSSE